ncbi:MAG: aconitase X [Thermomicrobiales bacterium]
MSGAHSLHLTETERGMLAGDDGPAAALAMRILTRVAPLYGADRFIEVTKAHIDGIVYEGNAGLAFAERLADLGGRVRVPTSLNVMSMDRTNWRALGQDPQFADNARRLGMAYVRMGAVPGFTCAPYHTEATPVFGEQIAWSESNAVAYANSVIGARTNRYGDYLDISCALTGRVPASGLHLTEHRKGTHHFRLAGISRALQERDDFYPVLGYLLGQSVSSGVPVIDGLDVDPTSDQLKALAAAAASSGAIALFHIVGVTPEAPDLQQAFRRTAVAVGSRHARAAASGAEHTHDSNVGRRRCGGVWESPCQPTGVCRAGLTDARTTCEARPAGLSDHKPSHQGDSGAHRRVARDRGLWNKCGSGYLHCGRAIGETRREGIDDQLGEIRALRARDHRCRFDLWFDTGMHRGGSQRQGSGGRFGMALAHLREPLVDGAATGTALVTDTPLSFWVVDPRTGEVIDRRHPLAGTMTGRVLALPAGRILLASGVLLESIANGAAPVGIVISEIDPIIGLGAILGEELLGITVPVVLVTAEERASIVRGVLVSIEPGGTIVVGE